MLVSLLLALFFGSPAVVVKGAFLDGFDLGDHLDHDDPAGMIEDIEFTHVYQRPVIMDSMECQKFSDLRLPEDYYGGGGTALAFENFAIGDPEHEHPDADDPLDHFIRASLIVDPPASPPPCVVPSESSSPASASSNSSSSPSTTSGSPFEIILPDTYKAGTPRMSSTSSSYFNPRHMLTSEQKKRGWHRAYQNMHLVYNHLFPGNQMAWSDPTKEKNVTIANALWYSVVSSGVSLDLDSVPENLITLLQTHPVTLQTVMAICKLEQVNTSTLGEILGFASLGSVGERINELVAWMVVFCILGKVYAGNLDMHLRLSQLVYDPLENQFSIRE